MTELMAIDHIHKLNVTTISFFHSVRSPSPSPSPRPPAGAGWGRGWGWGKAQVMLYRFHHIRENTCHAFVATRPPRVGNRVHSGSTVNHSQFLRAGGIEGTHQGLVAAAPGLEEAYSWLRGTVGAAETGSVIITKNRESSLHSKLGTRRDLVGGHLAGDQHVGGVGGAELKFVVIDQLKLGGEGREERRGEGGKGEGRRGG